MIDRMSVRIAVTAALLTSQVTVSMAEEAADPGTLTEVVVTGTRRTDRTVAESAVPIDVFTADDLKSQPSGDLNTVMRSMVPSFNVGRYVGVLSDGSGFVRPPTLRGLPPDQILVLVNGKRRHRSALVQLNGGALTGGAQGVDLAQIPTVAIERLEVLRDGAAAQYGSDAIAGVMNFGLKRGTDGLEVNTRYGQYSRGDGDSTQVSANLGLPLGDTGFFNVSAEYLRSLETSRGGQRPGAYALLQARPDLAGAIANPVQRFGDPDVKAYRSFVNAGYEFANGAELYAFGNYGESDQAAQFNFRQPLSAVGPAQSGVGTQLYPASTVFNPIYLDRLPDGTYDVNGRKFSFLEVTPHGYNPRFLGDVSDQSLTAGYKGETGSGLTYDFSASHGESKIEYRMADSFNLSLGPDSPRSFYLGSLEQRETNFNADFAFPVDVGIASPLTIAFGVEHRDESYIIGEGDYASSAIGPYTYQELSDGSFAAQPSGTNGFPGFGPSVTVNDSRKSYGVYIDAEGDLTQALTLGLAARYEHFADFGSTSNGKISARYAVNERLAFRGAASTGFRAPTPGQLFTTAGITFFIGPNPAEFLTLPATSAAAEYFGAQPLDPEKSVNFSVGLVATPLDDLDITVDYYNIKVTDRIGLSGIFDITTPEERAAMRDRGVANWATLSSLNFFTNAFATRTQGVDVVATQRTPTGAGTFFTTVAVNYNASKVIERDPAVIDDIRKGNIENQLPKVRGSVTQSWTLGDLSVMARGNYFHSWTDYGLVENGGQKTFGSEVTFDLEASYTYNSITFALGAENLLDAYPDRDIRSRGLPNSNWYESTQSEVNGSRYGDASPFGYNGMFFYGRLSMHF